MAVWYTVESDGSGEQTDRLLAAWPDAPIDNVESLAMLMKTAREQVTAYAPVMADPDVPEERYVLAQLRQAENLWNAGRVSGSGEIGVDQYVFTPRPLDKTVRQIIRPTGGFSVPL